MCGIAGYIGKGRPQIEFLYSSLKCLKHRGPDGSDLIDLNWAGLCHTRLALIAPGPNGAQPIESERSIIAFNGEIYNWKQLAKELEGDGVRASLNSDSKVLLHSIEVWGLEKTLKKLRGIFAFALIDKKSKSVKLVRDSAGTKPLYYLKHEGNTYFSSEIKSFMQFRFSVDIHQLHEYMTFQNFLGEGTIFENVFLVPAGSILHFDTSDAGPKKQIWENVVFTSGQNYSMFEATRKLETLIKQSIDRNLVADFPIGVFLSGGLDSSTIAQFSSEINRDTTSYTIGFKNESLVKIMNFNDEREVAKKIASFLKLENKTFEVSHEDMEREFDAICWAIEEPRVGQSYPNYFAAKLARKHGKAVLSGAGGDELFGGYPWRYRDTLNLQTLGKESQLTAYLQKWHRLGSFTEISQLLGLAETTHINQAKLKVEEILEQNSTNPNFYELQDLLYFEFKTFLHGLLLVDDKIAMSQGLEIRVPFLDQDLVNFAKNLPNDLRIKNEIRIKADHDLYQDNSTIEVDGKLVLRNLAREIQNPVSNLPKQGFTGPDESWFREESSEFIRERIFQPSSQLWNHIDYESSKKMVSEHLVGKKNHKSLIWSLLSLESLLRQFCN
jgi:asparagine synthase (glutamine-hydrolysing)